jgi:thiamine pyrophosphate-dependent acetolactate synthase large subunit-like protein
MVADADVILLLDVDVPYIQTQYVYRSGCPNYHAANRHLSNKPSPNAKVYHVDIDPLKQTMPVFYVAAKERYRADATTALQQLNAYIASQYYRAGLSRTSELSRVFKSRLEQLSLAEKPLDDGSISGAYLMGSLRDAVPKDTVYMIEAVTMTGIVFDHIRPSTPGSLFNSGAGGCKPSASPDSIYTNRCGTKWAGSVVPLSVLNSAS